MAIKSGSVAQQIRQMVLEGTWHPGYRLPTREALIKHFETSNATLQKAMDILLAEKIITSCGRGGTFVAEAPANLRTIAIAVPAGNRQFGQWELFWTLWLTNQHDLEKIFNSKFRFYYLADENDGGTELRKLRHDAVAGAICGIVFPYQPSESQMQQLVAITVPVVAVTREDHHAKLHNVWLDYAMFFDKALDFLQERHRRNLVLLTNDRLPMAYIDHAVAEAAKRGLDCPFKQRQAVSLSPFARPWIANLVELLFDRRAEERPDALIIANDNLLLPALEVMQRLNYIPGKDLDIVVQANFPSDCPFSQVTRIGFDLRRAVQSILEVIHEARSNPAAIIHNRMIPAITESDAKNGNPQ